MNYATEATLPEGVLIGTKNLHRRVNTRTQFLVIADNEQDATALIGRAFGEKAAQSSFTFGVDDLHRWFRATDSANNGPPLQCAIDTISLLRPRLGSISVTGAAFTFVGQTIRSFWIETKEDQRLRVLTGDRAADEDVFHPFPAEWEFGAACLAQAIIAQY